MFIDNFTVDNLDKEDYEFYMAHPFKAYITTTNFDEDAKNAITHDLLQFQRYRLIKNDEYL